MVFVTMLGLYFNTKTVLINEDIKTKGRLLRQLRHQNKELQYHILQAKRFDHLEKIATQNLSLVPTTKIIYFSNGDQDVSK
ncbi:hypothetical protein DID77_02685 [Candidatus Marinamargulisbacteria bacterium SCGC AG-439-L15]|nr:hypothetical protein DID77_02685 [Candidatus Marinamargulisbacteria bacterium SCGC AG-439-L15]